MKFTKNRLLSLLLVLAMMLALATTAFALTAGEIATVTLSTSTLTMGGATATASASCSKAEEGEGHEDGHTVTYSVASGNAVTVDSNSGVITAAHAGKATVKATCTCGASKVSNEITVDKATLTPATPTKLTLNVEKNISESVVKSRLTAAFNADTYQYADKSKVELGNWTLTAPAAFDSSTASTVLTYEAPLNAGSDYEYPRDTTPVKVTADVTVIEGPKVTFKDYKVNDVASSTKTLTVKEKTALSHKISVDFDVEPASGPSTSYQWYEKSGSVYTAISGTENSKTYTVPVDTVGTKQYVLKVTSTNNQAETVAYSDPFTVEVKPEYLVTVTNNITSTARVGNTVTFTAKVQVYDESLSTANKYRDAVAADKTSVTFTNNFVGTYKSGSVTAYDNGSGTYTVYLNGIYNGSSSNSSDTVTATATLSVNGTTKSAYTGTSNKTFYPAVTANVTILPTTGSYALIDLYSLQQATYSALSVTPTSVGLNGYPYGTFSATGSTSTSSTATLSSSTSSTYFTLNSGYAGFTNSNITVAFTAFNGSYLVATGDVKFSAASSITYNTTSSTPVYFKASDFSDYFKTALGGTYNSSYYTLSYVTFGTPRVSNSSVTSGTLYYNNGYVYSTTQVPAANLGYVSYTPSSSTYTYTVSIPFTAYGTYYYGSSSAKTVSGTVTIKVNDGHVITMVGTDFKSASIWSDILSKHPGVSYVSFSQPQSTVGKLYYGYTSIASKGSLVSYTDRFTNSSYNYSYASTNKSIDGIYFVPAADCLDTVTLTYTAYTSATATTGVSDTITFTITKKTASSIFNDVTASNTGKWSADAIDFLARNSIVEGGSYGTFNPTGNMTRGDFVLMLYRLAGKPSVSGISNPFTDVKSSDYYYNAILWAYRNDIVTGVDAKTFAPKKNITREQIAATLYRTAGSPSTSGYITGYYDYTKVHSYATNAMRWAVSNGVITGSNGYLTPTNNATRAQVATMLHRYLTK